MRSPSTSRPPGWASSLEREAAPIETTEALEAFVRKVQTEKPDAVLVNIQHMACWKMADKIATDAGVPAIIFAPVGMSFTGHVLKISRRPGVHVISSLDTGAVEQAMRMVRAKRQFAESRLLVVAGKDRKESTLDVLGTKIRRVPRSSLNELFAKMPETDETHEVVAQDAPPGQEDRGALEAGHAERGPFLHDGEAPAA